MKKTVFIAAWRICGDQHTKYFDDYFEAVDYAEEKGGVVLKQVDDPHSGYTYAILV